MDNFRKSGPGGLRNRAEFVGGRPKSDADYGTKKKFGKKPGFDKDRGGDRGGRGDGSDRGKRGGVGGGRGDRGGFGGQRGGLRREVELFKTTCSACGKTAEVPFRPDGSKPVLCRECFGGKSDDRGAAGKRDRFASDRGDRKPERSFDGQRKDREPSGDYHALLQQVQTLEGKVNEILTILKGASVPAEAPVSETAPIEESVETEVAAALAKETKEKKPKKVATKKAAKKVVKKVAKKVIKKK
jgi:CxxC-x17-CxxC domain-containing protein